MLFNPKPGEAGLPLFPSLLVSRARHVESLVGALKGHSVTKGRANKESLVFTYMFR